MFKVIILPKALSNIQDAVDYYDEQQIGLEERFKNYLNTYIVALQENPFYQIRYDEIRCLPLKKFPFMLHYNIDEKEKAIEILALVHTSQNPNQYWVKEPDLEYNINAMRNLQVSIPDSFYNSFIEFLKQEPKAEVSEERFSEIPESVQALVEMRHKTAKRENMIPAQDVIDDLKKMINV